MQVVAHSKRVAEACDTFVAQTFDLVHEATEIIAWTVKQVTETEKEIKVLRYIHNNVHKLYRTEILYYLSFASLYSDLKMCVFQMQHSRSRVDAQTAGDPQVQHQRSVLLRQLFPSLHRPQLRHEAAVRVQMPQQYWLVSKVDAMRLNIR